MAITGAHMLFYTSEPERLRAVMKDVFGWDHVDAGEGWLIFKLPPAEIGVHPSDGATTHQITLMCDDIAETVADLSDKGISFSGEVKDEGFGLTIPMSLPGGVEVLLYEVRHPTPLDV